MLGGRGRSEAEPPERLMSNLIETFKVPYQLFRGFAALIPGHASIALNQLISNSLWRVGYSVLFAPHALLKNSTTGVTSFRPCG